MSCGTDKPLNVEVRMHADAFQIQVSVLESVLHNTITSHNVGNAEFK